MKPKKKIDELLLLVTIYLYTKKYLVLPTAEVLMELKSEFAPSLLRVDTLRMWLLRHKGRVIRRSNKCRPYRYELNRQGEKRIVFLVERFLRSAILDRQCGPLTKPNSVRLYSIASELAKTPEKKVLLLKLFKMVLDS